MCCQIVRRRRILREEKAQPEPFAPRACLIQICEPKEKPRPEGSSQRLSGRETFGETGHEPDRSSIPIAIAPRMARSTLNSHTERQPGRRVSGVSRGDSGMMHDATCRIKTASRKRVWAPTGAMGANPVELIPFRADSASWARYRHLRHGRFTGPECHAGELPGSNAPGNARGWPTGAAGVIQFSIPEARHDARSGL